MQVLFSILLLWSVAVWAQENGTSVSFVPVNDTDRKGRRKRPGCPNRLRMEGHCSDYYGDEEDDRDEELPSNCTDSPTPFENEVFVEYVGIPDLVTPFDIMTLEQAFLETYNGFTNSACDGLSFRTVEQVQITTDPLADNMRRGLQISNGTNFTRSILLRPFVYRLFVRGTCRGCRNDRLFSDEGVMLGGQRSLQEDESSSNADVWHGGHGGRVKGSMRSSKEKEKKMKDKKAKSKIKGGTGNDVEDNEGDDGDMIAPDEGPCPECIPPTAANFTIAYDTNIRALASNGTLQNVDRVNNAAELENVTCNFTTSFFETDVFVDFVGDVNQSLPLELDALAQGFLETYNGLNAFDPNNCDRLFREVEQVEVVNTDAFFNRRALQSADMTNTTNSTLPSILLRPFVFQFRVRGRCRGCRRDTNLFDEGISFRRLEEAEVGARGSLSVRHLQQQPDDCVCAIGANETRAPTREEFTVNYNSTVRFLVLEEQVQFVEEVVETTEVDPITCPAPTEFETEVFLDFFGDPESAGSFEELALESNFVSTYNVLAETFCDPLFRTVLEAQIVGVGENGFNPPGARLLEDSMTAVNDTAPPLNGTLFRSFQYVFRVRGRCRGCRRDANLFDDGVRLKATSRNGRRLEDSTTCFCDTNPVDFRAPSEQEFESDYNTTVNTLELPNVVALENVDEPNPSASPSLSPIPTASPNDSGLLGPTIDFPYVLSDVVFGDVANRDALPLYFIDRETRWNEAPGVFEGFRSSDEALVTIAIDGVTSNWEMIQESANVTFTGSQLEFIQLNNFRATLIFGFLSGPGATFGEFGGIVASTELSDVVIPFYDRSAVPLATVSFAREATLPPRPKERKLKMQEQMKGGGETALEGEVVREKNSAEVVAEMIEIESWLQSTLSPIDLAERRLQSLSSNSTCDSFLSEVGESLVCNEGEFKITNETCTIAAQSFYNDEASVIRLPLVEFQNIFNARVRQWLEKRGADTALGYVGCSANPGLDTCMSGVHRSASTVAVNEQLQFVAELLASQRSLEATASSQFLDLCDRARSLASACFPCAECSVGLPNVQCCSNEDCIGQAGDVCVSNTCVFEGNPRFTLSWTGDDDLDLHVITPFGVEIFFSNLVDPVTGGRLDQDDIPRAFAFYVENIFFPSPTDGNYTYFVDEFNRVGFSDAWVLQAFVDGVEVARHTGVGTSGLFVLGPFPLGSLLSPAPSAAVPVSPAPSSLSPVTLAPSISPTISPTTATPSIKPTLSPITVPPTIGPTTAMPSIQPTVSPTTATPSIKPTLSPITVTPTIGPTTATPSIQPTVSPTTATPTIKPTTAAPSIKPTLRPATATPSLAPTTLPPSLSPSFMVDSELLRSTIEFPYALSDAVFGDVADRSRLPFYVVDNDIIASLAVGPRGVTLPGFRFSDESSVTIFVDLVFAEYAFGLVDSRFFYGALAGPNATFADFGGIVVATAETTVVFPLYEPVPAASLPPALLVALSSQSQRARGLKRTKHAALDSVAEQKEADKRQASLLYAKKKGSRLESTWEGRRKLQVVSNSSCDSFLVEVADSLVCNAGDAFNVNDTCTAEANAIYMEEATTIRQPLLVDFPVQVELALRNWHILRGRLTVDGYNECLNVAPLQLDTCMSRVHASVSVTAVVEQVAFVEELLATLETLQTTADGQFVDLCERSRSMAASCFSCEVCSLDANLTNVDCCSNEDCIAQEKGDTCVSNKCVLEGSPRFTLSWTGDDDLDLYAITPFGFQIYHEIREDPVTGGRLDRDEVPTMFGLHVENIFFPSPTSGNYTYFVDAFSVIGLVDPWLLQVFVDGVEVANHTGVGSSERFILGPFP